MTKALKMLEKMPLSEYKRNRAESVVTVLGPARDNHTSGGRNAFYAFIPGGQERAVSPLVCGHPIKGPRRPGGNFAPSNVGDFLPPECPSAG